MLEVRQEPPGFRHGEIQSNNQRVVKQEYKIVLKTQCEKELTKEEQEVLHKKQIEQLKSALDQVEKKYGNCELFQVKLYQ